MYSVYDKIAQKGSPPHMRGKAQEWMKEGKAERITPAYAGKSVTDLKQQFVDQDHPRICGEKLSMY